ncbi:MAG: hypothetical protein WDN25_24685 [Acetobacteraceae bacterium]
MEAAAPSPKRRLRYTRRSTGKRVTPTERDLAWFKALQRHGSLPSSFLLAFTRHLCRSETRALERLGDLYHESNTPHGGPYLNRPAQQWSAISKFQRAVYDLAPAAEQALDELGIRKGTGPEDVGGLYRHRLMVACVTASIELAVKKNPSLRYISQAEILARSPHKTVVIPCSVSYTNPRTGKRQMLEKPLVPDAIFGLEYAAEAGRRYRFFMVEADRNHEPVIRADLRETSYLRKVLQYRQVIGRGIYREHFGMKSPMLLLTITTNARHMSNIQKMTAEVFGRAGCPYLLFATLPAFGDSLCVPSPCDQLSAAPWQRTGYSSMRIDQAEDT